MQLCLSNARQHVCPMGLAGAGVALAVLLLGLATLIAYTGEQRRAALVVVDMQPCFMPGGSLAVSWEVFSIGATLPAPAPAGERDAAPTARPSPQWCAPP